MNHFQLFRSRWGRTIRWVLIFSFATLWAQSSIPLFSVTARPNLATAVNPSALREAYMRVDWQAFTSVTNPEQVTQLLSLNLFDDSRYLAERVKLNWLGPHRFDWIGQIGNDDVILAVRDGHMVGTVQKGRQLFEIRSVDGITHLVTEINQEYFNEMDLAEPIQEAQSQDIPMAPVPVNAPLTLIDVMVFYNQGVMTKNPNMEAYLGSLIALSNRSYERSGIPQEIRLVYHALATKCNSSDANSCNNSDPDVVAARKKYGADITGFIFDGTASYCGVSNGNCCMTAIYSCALSNKSFPHEFGHNMGAGHDVAQGGTSGYAHGFLNTTKKWRTIMAYPCSGVSGGCPRIDHFSSPLIMYNGDPTGTEASEDNARRMRERMVAVAAREPTMVAVNLQRRVILDPKANFSLSRISDRSLTLYVNREENLIISSFSLKGNGRELAHKNFSSGEHLVTWESGDLTPGIHILQIRGKSGQRIYKILVMK